MVRVEGLLWRGRKGSHDRRSDIINVGRGGMGGGSL